MEKLLKNLFNMFIKLCISRKHIEIKEKNLSLIKFSKF